MEHILKRYDDSHQSLVVLKLLEETEKYTFDLTLNDPDYDS